MYKDIKSFLQQHAIGISIFLEKIINPKIIKKLPFYFQTIQVNSLNNLVIFIDTEGKMPQSIRTQSRQRTICLNNSVNSSLPSKSECRSINSSIQLGKYEQTLNEYKEFLNIFQEKIESVYEKEKYRIYLTDKSNEKIYKDLLNEKDQLVRALEDSKDYRQSANRVLIEQVMNLQRMKEQYEGRNSECESKITKKKKQITEKKKKLKQLQTQIKSYWVYNYEITSTSMASQSIIKTLSKGNKYSVNVSKVIAIKNKQNRDSNKENTINESINSQLPNLSTLHLPSIAQHSRHSSQMRLAASSNRLNQNQSITVFSKDLSLINSSSTREKLIYKMQESNKHRAHQRLQYEREKLNLLKLFKTYLQNLEDQRTMTERFKLEKIVNQLEERINFKDQKLKEIQLLIS